MRKLWAALSLLFIGCVCQELTRLVTRFYDHLYHHSVSSLLDSLSLTEISPDDELVPTIHQAAVLANDIYSGNIEDSIVISSDRRRRPECVIKLVDGDLWVVVRGTMTAVDLLRDMTWSLAAKFSTRLSVPAGVLLHADDISARIRRVLDSELRNKPVKRIFLTGHSLGGSIATVIYFNFLWKLQLKFPMKVFTFGSPYVTIVHEEKTGVNHTQAEVNVFNIIYQLDIIPRLLGATSLPNHLLISKFYAGNAMNTARRRYSAFGRYIVASKSGRIDWVRNVSDFMSVFPANEVDFLYSVMNDHSMKRIIPPLQRLLMRRSELR